MVKNIKNEVKYNFNQYFYFSREFKKVRVQYYTDDTIKLKITINKRNL